MSTDDHAGAADKLKDAKDSVKDAVTGALPGTDPDTPSPSGPGAPGYVDNADASNDDASNDDTDQASPDRS